MHVDMVAQDLPQEPAIRRFQASLTLSITLTTRSITGSETSGVIPVNHRYTPRQDRMPRSLFHDPPLKLGVPNTIGDFRTSAATKPTDVRDAHPVC